MMQMTIRTVVVYPDAVFVLFRAYPCLHVRQLMSMRSVRRSWNRKKRKHDGDHKTRRSRHGNRAQAITTANRGRVAEIAVVPTRVKIARANVTWLEIAQFLDAREGNAMKTHAVPEETIELLLRDGRKDIYLPMMKIDAPKMQAASIVIADNVFTFKTAPAPYLTDMRNQTNGFESVTQPYGYGMKYSVRCF